MSDIPFRRRVRVVVAALLYQYRFFREEPERFEDAAHLIEGNPRVLKAAKELFQQVVPHYDKIDSMVDDLSKWDPERLDLTDRAVVILGIYELLYTKLDTPVVINEAVEVAKMISGGTSYRFVNAVLDKVAREVRNGL